MKKQWAGGDVINKKDVCQANKFIPRENDKNYPALVS